MDSQESIPETSLGDVHHWIIRQARSLWDRARPITVHYLTVPCTFHSGDILWRLFHGGRSSGFEEWSPLENKKLEKRKRRRVELVLIVDIEWLEVPILTQKKAHGQGWGGRAGIFRSGKSIYLREGWQFRRHFPGPNCSATVGTVRLSKSFHSALVQCMNCTKGGRDVLCWEGTRIGLGHSLTAFVAGYYCNGLAHYCLEVRVSRQLLREVGTTSHCNQTSGTNIMTGSLTRVEVFLFLFLSYDEVLGCPLRFLVPIISISQFFTFAFSVFQEIYSGLFFKCLEIGLYVRG